MVVAYLGGVDFVVDFTAHKQGEPCIYVNLAQIRDRLGHLVLE